MSDKQVLCDCHFAPMYYEPVSIIPERDFVMCWTADCGRYYNKSLGYFHLRPAMPSTLERIDKFTRRMTRCLSDDCSEVGSMALVRSAEATNQESKACWYCFECDMEFLHDHTSHDKRRSRSSGSLVTDSQEPTA